MISREDFLSHTYRRFPFRHVVYTRYNVYMFVEWMDFTLHAHTVRFYRHEYGRKLLLIAIRHVLQLKILECIG
jgi:hypothetical protein